MAKKAAIKNEDESNTLDDKQPKKKKEDLLDFIINGHALVARPKVVIPISPAIDVATGGGIPEGSFFIPTGKPKLGKTVTALQLACNAQKPQYKSKFDDTGRDVYFYNIEGRLKSRDLLGIRGLNLDKFHIIESRPGRILSGEDYIDTAERLINERPGTVHIFDSFSQLCTAARRDGDIRDRVRDDAPLLLANFCKRICNVLPVNDTIVVGITHIIANQGGGPMSKPTSEASGNKIQYGSDTKLVGKYTEKWEVGGQQVGQIIHWRCEWSALSGPGELTSYLRYGYGLDKESELITLAVGLGIITKGGAWFTFKDGTQAQGLEKARNVLVERPELYEATYAELREMLQLKAST